MLFQWHTVRSHFLTSSSSSLPQCVGNDVQSTLVIRPLNGHSSGLIAKSCHMLKEIGYKSKKMKEKPRIIRLCGSSR